MSNLDNVPKGKILFRTSFHSCIGYERVTVIISWSSKFPQLSGTPRRNQFPLTKVAAGFGVILSCLAHFGRRRYLFPCLPSRSYFSPGKVEDNTKVVKCKCVPPYQPVEAAGDIKTTAIRCTFLLELLGYQHICEKHSGVELVFCSALLTIAKKTIKRRYSCMTSCPSEKQHSFQGKKSLSLFSILTQFVCIRSVQPKSSKSPSKVSYLSELCRFFKCIDLIWFFVILHPCQRVRKTGERH